jgi:hypothetical protein
MKWVRIGLSGFQAAYCEISHSLPSCAEIMNAWSSASTHTFPWCHVINRDHWDFSFTYSSRPHCGPDIDPASTRNYYRRYLLVGKGGRCVGLTILPPSCADCLETLEASTSCSPKGLSRTIIGQLNLYLWTSLTRGTFHAVKHKLNLDPTRNLPRLLFRAISLITPN